MYIIICTYLTIYNKNIVLIIKATKIENKGKFSVCDMM